MHAIRRLPLSGLSGLTEELTNVNQIRQNWTKKRSNRLSPFGFRDMSDLSCGCAQSPSSQFISCRNGTTDDKLAASRE
jgi:hypothetical protein